MKNILTIFLLFFVLRYEHTLGIAKWGKKGAVTVFLFVVLMGLSTSEAYAQINGQDPSTAMNVCNSSLLSIGAVPPYDGPPFPTGNCLYAGARNPFWYVFNITTTGTLGFTITPNTLTDDYDFVVFNITGLSPSSVFTNAPVLSCNYGSTSGVTGCTPAGTLNSQGPSGSNTNALINVTAGMTIALCVSHYTSFNQSGYTLAFTGGTISAVDTQKPGFDSVLVNHCNEFLMAKISESITCTSIDIDGSDFYITPGNIAVAGALGIGCGASNFTKDIKVTLPVGMSPGNYVLHVKNGTSENSLRDLCGNDFDVNSTLPFTVTGVAFNVNASGQCLNGNNFVFTNTTTIASGSLASYTWSYGDGTTDTLAKHTYAAAGADTVKLVVVSDKGCKDSITHTMTVYPKPIVAFNVNDSGQCLNGNNFVFGNTSSIASGSLASYAWNYGDGSTVTTINGSHTYTTAGTDTVKLVAFSDKGCKDSITNTIIVYPKPTVAFSVNDLGQCVNRNDFVFKNTSSITFGSLAYVWNYGDGNTEIINDGSHTYTAAGTDTVKLVATSDKGCKDSTTKTITLYPKPTVAFSVNALGQCLNGNNFVFSNTSSIVSGSLASYAWNYGDGSTAMTNNGSHSYTAAGTDTVKLVVVSDKGCKDSITHALTLYPKPTVTFSVNDSGQCVNSNNFVFSNTSSIASGSLASYAWSYGDGATATTSNGSHSYTAVGGDTVKLVAFSDKGCKDSATHTITIYPKPTVAFSVNDSGQCVNGNNFMFTNTSSITSGSLASYAWNYGDGSTAMTNNGSHTYAAAGTDTVKLIVASDKGCRDSITEIMTVYPKPMVAFSVNDSGQCVNRNDFVFSNTSSIASGSLAYVWSYGDGNTEIINDGSHTYATAGTDVVKLVASSDKDCRDSATHSITVYPKPAVTFSVNDSAQCVNSNNFVFNNASSITSGSLAYVWSYGDGGTATTPNGSHTYTAAGTDTVKLVVASDKGCKDSVTTIMTVYPKPMVAFSVDLPDQCLTGNNFVFTNTSVISSGVLTYSWNYGDGTTDTMANHSYATAGNYGVKLIATSDKNCKESLTRANLIQVYALPHAQMETSPANLILPNSTLNLLDRSTDAVKWNWLIFNDSMEYYNSADQNTSYTFDGKGQFSIRLVIESQYGCKDTTTQMCEVKGGMSFVANAFTPNGDGINEFFRPVFNGVLSDHYIFRIFNRWGQKVFETNNPDAAWDGTFSGRPAATDVYEWSVEGFFDGRIGFSKKGTVTLLR